MNLLNYIYCFYNNENINNYEQCLVIKLMYNINQTNKILMLNIIFIYVIYMNTLLPNCIVFIMKNYCTEI